MCAINLGKVLYVTEREESLEAAQRGVAIVDQLPIEVVDPERAPGVHRCPCESSSLHLLCRCVCGSPRRDGCIVTGDPEFEQVELLVPVRWLAGA
jgi:hypothetical protein